ncbi:MAG TPA: zinc-dependent alcohol dehydrogenase [Acidimicrobiales bacterium]|nr:zinc-dependent alcohol dehydrogenase [Acidimicrobiales bacterium]
MRAVVFNGVGDIGVEQVDDPRIESPSDAIVRVTTSAICGTDLHFVRGTFSGMVPGTVLGHEAIGIVEEAGSDVRNLAPGDRVVIPSTIACGACSYCRAGYYSQCDVANPNGPEAGTCFFGGPKTTGPIDGLQAEYARIPFAHTGPVKLPEQMSDDDAILLSDIFPTSWFAARLAEVRPGDTVAVFGAGIVGQLAMASAVIQGAGRVFAVDAVPSRLELARMQGAEPVNFEREHPVETLKRLTNGIGVDRVIDAVGVDANRPHEGPAAGDGARFDRQRSEVAPTARPDGGNWEPGDGPGQVLEWAVSSVAKGGTIGVVGVYPPEMTAFPIGMAMNKNVTLKMGNCNHRRYLPELIDLVASGRLSLSPNVTQQETFDTILDAYRAFDRREPGWVKVAVLVGGGSGMQVSGRAAMDAATGS